MLRFSDLGAFQGNWSTHMKFRFSISHLLRNWIKKTHLRRTFSFLIDMLSSDFRTSLKVRGICCPEDRSTLIRTNTEGLKENDEANATLSLF